MKNKHSTRFNESTKNKVDSVTGKITGVHFIGLKSANSVGDKPPYSYESAALMAAAGKYENVPMKLNHSYMDRVEDKIAVTSNVKFIEGKGLVGDITVNVKHPMGPAVLWWAEQAPRHISLSHDALVKYNEETNSVTEIHEVQSVDIVYQGATTVGLFAESTDPATQLDNLLAEIQSLAGEYVFAPLNKDIDIKESCVKYLSVLRKAAEELKQPKHKQESNTMELKDITLEMLTKDRKDLVSAIESTAAKAAIDAHVALEAKVVEAIKDIAQEHRSAVFVATIRESLLAGKDVKALVEDRKTITEAVKSSGQAKSSGKSTSDSAPVKLTEAELLASF
jgi:hypothetical protein